MTLLVVDKTGQRTFEMKGSQLHIGRSSKNDLVLKEKGVSRRHCVIRNVHGYYMLYDLGSKNGTYVNCERITAARLLEAGDKIEVGLALLVLGLADEGKCAEKCGQVRRVQEEGGPDDSSPEHEAPGATRARGGELRSARSEASQSEWSRHHGRRRRRNLQGRRRSPVVKGVLTRFCLWGASFAVHAFVFWLLAEVVVPGIENTRMHGNLLVYLERPPLAFPEPQNEVQEESLVEEAEVNEVQMDSAGFGPWEVPCEAPWDGFEEDGEFLGHTSGGYDDVRTDGYFRTVIGVGSAFDRLGGAGGGGGRVLCCDPRKQSIIEAGLDWLARHQSPEGYWDCDGFCDRCMGEGCGGPGKPVYDVGVTGLALLSFVGMGNTSESGEYRYVVKRGMDYLRSVQSIDGCFGPKVAKYMYCHAIATLAVSECYGRSGSYTLWKPLEKGVEFIIRNQSSRGGWRYAAGDNDSDTSVTAWMVLCLTSAQRNGLGVPGGVHEGVRKWLDNVVDERSGRVGYKLLGDLGARFEEHVGIFPSMEAMTSAGLVSRWLIDGEVDRSARGRSMRLIMQCTPSWFGGRDRADMYAWYYGTLAAYLEGGASREKWEKELVLSLGHNQRRDGCAKGSWDPVGPWGGTGGRVYSTAIDLLSLEVEVGQVMRVFER